jgi:ferritin-like metal-binding protein YciE
LRRTAAFENVIAIDLNSSPQAVEHCEIARYSTLIAWADQLGLKMLCHFCNHLAEEEATDKKLMQLAQSRQAARKGRLGRPLRLNGMAGSNAIWAGLNRRR